MFLLLVSGTAFGQKQLDVISMEETKRIEATLSSDEMQGRRTFTPGIEKAANFIAAEFEKIGLKKWNNGNSFLQSFAMIRPKTTAVKATMNDNTIDAKKISISSIEKSINITEKSGYEIASVARGTNFVNEWRKLLSSTKNTIVFVDTTHAAIFSRVTQRGGQLYPGQPSVIFVLQNEKPSSFSIEATQEITEMPLANVVGVLPGKSKANEYVIFSGHYDHLGINSRNMQNNDSIYNGAIPEAPESEKGIAEGKEVLQEKSSYNPKKARSRKSRWFQR